MSQHVTTTDTRDLAVADLLMVVMSDEHDESCVLCAGIMELMMMCGVVGWCTGSKKPAKEMAVGC